MINNFSCEEAQIELPNQQNLIIKVKSKAQENPLLHLSAENAKLFGEEPTQLLEGCSYDYQLPADYSIITVPGIIEKNSFTKHLGSITPGNYVGRLTLTITTSENDIIERAVEVRSVKTKYRSDYRTMLENITEECAELLMIHSSPVTQRFAPDHYTDPKTLYQRFAFVKSIVDSEDFHDAVQRILTMPVTAWKQHTEEIDIRRSKKIGPTQIRQIATRQNRINLPQNHPLRKHTALTSVPFQITSTVKTDSVDTPENRFIKHALLEFQNFCGEVKVHIEVKIKDESKRPHVYKEATALEERFAEYLNHNIFREIQLPTTLPLNSPILQRKEGYRQILKTWLLFDLAAKLTWGVLEDDDYHVGKRDVAALYEYWLFFKLLRLVEDIFAVPAEETKDLIKPTADGLGLQLKAGKHVAVSGSYRHKNRDLRIKFCYNRTFSNSVFPRDGSWTHSMRPDYTLSIWPKDFCEKEAEAQELIVHVHFDAKYKVSKGQYLFSGEQQTRDDSDTELLEEKKEQREGTYNNADLLKMHAYKDAIRRTVGAYVLYPGDKAFYKKGFHEIIPGLGAFPVSPSNETDCMKDVRKFIFDVLDHFTNRASQREQLSFHNYEIHTNDQPDEVHDMMPERVLNTRIRIKPPGDVTVLVGFYNKEQYAWIESKGLYNIRIDPKNGLKNYRTEIMGAKYLLLHGKNELETGNIWEITGDAPELVSKRDLSENMKYPTEPSVENYLVFKIQPVVDSTFGRKIWDVRKIPGFKKNRASSIPFSATLTSLLKAVVA
jgi:predicted component of viral defense system (DUF524 family)